MVEPSLRIKWAEASIRRGSPPGIDALSRPASVENARARLTLPLVSSVLSVRASRLAKSSGDTERRTELG
jgi:hypothetical protein